ncbi:TonB-dependent hemoglobin/transferrin/lactoferrin family receptor [Halioxenophilus aromaticivorans]|uniref:TonB-dependent hemoglobin/transferrin/lactoferrin family receptor n=1 Tax=Halioxenophilus aromaticivorans TaxID=1306992 RepID=A0AAV3U4B6_9ALTE
MNKYAHKINLLAACIMAAATANAEEDVVRLSTLVVEAANESSVSNNTTVISDEDIANASMDNIEDSVRYIPGVQVNDAGNRFGDDGFNIRGLEGDAVAVTVDGVSLGETLAPASFSAYGMYDSTRGQVELEHVKSIRITKGPSAVSKGTNALAGSVAYTTHDASDFIGSTGDELYFGTKLGFDSRDHEKKGHVTFANRAGSFESLIQYTYRTGEEMQAHGDGQALLGSARETADPQDKTSSAVLAKFAYQLTPTQKLGLMYEDNQRNTEGTPLSRDSATYYNFHTDDDNDRTRYGIFYHWDNTGLALFDSLSATLDLQEGETTGVTAFDYSSRGLNILRIEDRSTSQDATVLNLDFEKHINAGVRQTLDYGFDWSSREMENVMYDRRYNGFDTASGYMDGYPERDPAWVPKTETNSFSVYFSDAIKISDAFTVTLGARYDNTEYNPEVGSTFEDSTGVSVVDAEFDAWVGQLIAEYEFMPGQSILASYTQGYQAPTVQDMYLGTDGGTVIEDTITGESYLDLDTVANANLEAEQSSSMELGYKLESEKASFTVTGYWATYDNKIQTVSNSTAYSSAVNAEECGFDFATMQTVCTPTTITEDEWYQPANVGEIDVNGIEIDATYAFSKNVFAHFTFATIDGEYQTTLDGVHNKGDALETAAPDTGTLTLGYLASNGKWGVQLHALWFDSIDEQLQPDEAEALSVAAGDLSFTALNNGSGPAYYPDAYTLFDLNAFYKVTDKLNITLAAYNLADKEYYRWEVLNSIRAGSGGFFGGVSDQGYKRYSEPGRSFSLDVAYRF